jgi:hypothetical protein
MQDIMPSTFESAMVAQTEPDLEDDYDEDDDVKR